MLLHLVEMAHLLIYGHQLVEQHPLQPDCAQETTPVLLVRH